MLPPVFQALKASQAVKDIVGTNSPRIYRHGKAPDGTPDRPIAEPYITWFMVSGIPENNLSDPPPCDRATVQVDCWYPDRGGRAADAGIELLARAARDALEQIGVMTAAPIDDYETTTKTYRISLQVDVFINH
jgi:hypothetical protein